MNHVSRNIIRISDLVGFMSIREAMIDYVAKLRLAGSRIIDSKHQVLREQYQAIMLTAGISKLQQKPWAIRMVEEEPIDFEAMTIDMENKTFDFVGVQNVMLPQVCAPATNDFSEFKIAEFIYTKKPRRALRGDYDRRCIFGVYMNFKKKNLRIDELSKEICKNFSGDNEVWVHGPVSSDRKNWHVARVYPLFSDQVFFEVDLLRGTVC